MNAPHLPGGWLNERFLSSVAVARTVKPGQGITFNDAGHIVPYTDGDVCFGRARVVLIMGTIAHFHPNGITTHIYLRIN